jgi:hypothetical protein
MRRLPPWLLRSQTRKFTSSHLIHRHLANNQNQTSQHLLVALSQSGSKPPKAQSADATVGDLPPPSVASVEKLRELSTKKLSEIVRRSMGGERGWDGYDQAELIAARELLDRDTQSVQR